MKKITMFALCVIVVGIILTSSICVYKFWSWGKQNTLASKKVVELTFLELPLLNKSVNLVLRVTPKYSGYAICEIILPEGFEYVSGNLTWNGGIAANETTTINATVKSVKVGYHEIRAYANFGHFESNYTDTLWVEVSEITAIIGSKFKNTWYSPSYSPAIPLPENNESIESDLHFSALPHLNEEITITYTVTPLIDIPDPNRTQMSLSLPPMGFEIINTQFPEGGKTYQHINSLAWKGNISKNETVQISVVVKIVSEGEGSIYGYLDVQAGGGIEEFMRAVSMYDLHVDEYTSTLTQHYPSQAPLM